MKKIILLSAIITLAACKKEEDVNPVTTNTEISYTASVKPIMQNYCYTCHSGSSPSADLRLDNYQDVKNSAMNNLIARMKDTENPMPPSGNLSNDKINIIEDWIAEGYLE